MKSARQLIDAAITCVKCGKKHEPWRTMSGGQSWASKKDGHAYSTRLYNMTGNTSWSAIAALQQLAEEK